MRVTFINKSDSLGGAAVVTLRLVEALRRRNVDARLLVTHKGTDKEYVSLAASSNAIRSAFLRDRLPLLLRNGFSRRTLFQIDAARAGLPLWKHPWVTEADALCLGWINQGVLSLEGIRKLMVLNKPMLWTMHDMWNMTGICHHAHDCKGFTQNCGNCPLLGKMASAHDLSHTVWRRKLMLYRQEKIQFVAVSSWLARKSAESSLLGATDGVNKPVVIPNAYPLTPEAVATTEDKEPRLLMVAARLDDPIKGLPLLVKATRKLAEKHKAVAEKLHLDLVGELRYKEAVKELAIPYTLHGTISERGALRELYRRASVVVSPSLFETLPGTLIEGMESGAVPVAFDRGGQSDIIDHLSTGYLTPWSGDADTDGNAFADGILWALEAAHSSDTLQRMHTAVAERFSADAVAQRYLELIQNQSSPGTPSTHSAPSTHSTPSTPSAPIAPDSPL